MRWWRHMGREQDLDRELRSDLELEAAEQQEKGLSAEEAQYAARRAFGNTTHLKEEVREMWGWTSLERLLQDLRYGLRTMRRSPGFTSIAVLSLALGIGANTAIFSLINSLMLRSLPVKEPERLVEILTRREKGHFNSFSWQTYQYLRDHNSTLTELLASHRDRLYTRAQGLEAEKIEGEYCTGNYFSMLGIRPVLGRLIGPADDQMGSPAPVAVVSWSYWKSRFGLDPTILGKKVLVEDVPFTIIGVTPPEFFGLQVGWSEDIFVPLAMEPVVRHQTYTSNAGYKWLQLVGRAKPGVSLQQLHAEMNVLFRRTLEIEALDRHDAKIPVWSIDVAPAGAGLSRLRDEFSKPLLVLLTIVCLLLLIACANVASMLLARGAARQREMAVRVSLGAGRFRLARQLVTESLLLSGIAAVLGVVLAYLGSDYLVRIMATGRLPIEVRVAPDGRVLLFTAGAALLTGLLFGLIPALRAMGASPASAMRDSSRGGETRTRRLFAKGLIVSQVAFSVVLVAAAGTFVRNLLNLKSLDIGIHRDHVLMVALDPSHSGYMDDQLSRDYQRLLERFQTIPGVRSASICWMPPVAGGGADGMASAEGSAARLYLYKNWVGPGYFDTVGIPLLAGRDFTFRDRASSPRVVIVNQTMAHEAFGSVNPLGRHITFKGADTNPHEIIGVVGDAKYLDIREVTQATAYLATFQQTRPASQFVVRTAIPPGQIVPAVRSDVRDILKTVLIGKVTTLAAHIDSSIVKERLTAMLSSLFGALGSLLAAIGLYGLLAYTVARRTNEIGIRMALGANRSDVTRMILREAVLLVAAGLVMGVPLAVAGEYAAARIIPNLPPGHWMSVAIGGASMVATGFVAAYLPSRRASRVDPIVALRYE